MLFIWLLPLILWTLCSGHARPLSGILTPAPDSTKNFAMSTFLCPTAVFNGVSSESSCMSRQAPEIKCLQSITWPCFTCHVADSEVQHKHLYTNAFFLVPHIPPLILTQCEKFKNRYTGTLENWKYQRLFSKDWQNVFSLLYNHTFTFSKMQKTY